MNLSSAEKEERDKRLRGIPLATLRERKSQGVCQRCGDKRHTQWFCPESQLKVTVASVQNVKPQKRKREEPDIKEESAFPDKKKKAAAIISMGGRIYELESESMDVDD
jgi:hypothetical protein